MSEHQRIPYHDDERRGGMLIALALDTSGLSGSVALVREDDAGLRQVLGREVIGRGMRHGVELFPAMERVLAAAGIVPRDVQLVAVGTGPGSYTGLRVGITAARAFAYAAGTELLGVPSCDAWAAAMPTDEHPLAVVLDAKVRAVYLAIYDAVDGATDALDPPRRWTLRDAPVLVAPADAVAMIPPDARVVGDARAAYAPHFDHFPTIAACPERADAAQVAELALGRHSRGEHDAIEEVLPMYLERSRPGAGGEGSSHV